MLETGYMYKLLVTLSLQMVSESVLIGVITSRKHIERNRSVDRKKSSMCVFFIGGCIISEKTLIVNNIAIKTSSE